MNRQDQTTLDARRLARITGWLYLGIIVCAGFAQGAVRGTIHIPGDPAATMANLLASPTLFRLGLLADGVAFVLDAVVAVLLYVLLRPVHPTFAMVAAALRLVAHPAIAGINLVFHGMALPVATGSYHGVLAEAMTRRELVMLLFEAHTTGYLLAGLFFGASLGVLGYLIYRSPRFPSVLGVLLFAAGIGYVIESAGSFVAPRSDDLYSYFVMIPAVLGEVGFTLWLLIRGVRDSGSSAREDR